MTLRAIQKWQELARPDASEKDISLALGIFLEEVAEVLEEFNEQYQVGVYNYHTASTMSQALTSYATLLKQGKAIAGIRDRGNLTKELSDIVVTAVGLGYVAKLDVPTACDRVNESNYSKFVDGKPVYDENGKVSKGAGYVKANMEGLY